MTGLIVIGGGGFAKEVIWLAQDCGYNVVGVLDDAPEMQGKTVLGIKVLGHIEKWSEFSDVEFILAIGSPRTRFKIFNKMELSGEPKFATLIHPSVSKSEFVSVGEGAIICTGSILTTDIQIGKHCILNLNVNVGHDCVLGEFVTIAPMVAISGSVELNDLVEVGTGAVIRQGLSIGKGAMLGMGGVLTKNIPSNFIFIGNPAKKFKEF
ncbi:acetyltransferase [Crocosphaera sp.]|uniref:acetyltransferase n=1 Tax=Crocosphaera sp. TaxID=2729996 RepID=UPI00257F3BE0|nr:acetyltransferase [Crocosphaera sp.]NQZ64375.1 acetyltransferase [Crocosphaera sp.]